MANAAHWMDLGSPTRQASGHTWEALLWLNHLKQKTHPESGQHLWQTLRYREDQGQSCLPPCLRLSLVSSSTLQLPLWLLLKLFAPSEPSLSRLPAWTEVLTLRLSRNHPGLRCQTGQLRHPAMGCLPPQLADGHCCIPS